MAGARETGIGIGASALIMRMLTVLVLSGVCVAQTVKIPPVKTALNLEGQPVEVGIWGTITAESVEHPRLSATVDLGDFQEKLTPVMAAQLNRSDRCGERLSVEHAALVPSGLLTANVHFERFGCVKAFGKEMVKRIVGGNAVVEVNLTPSIAENRVVLTGEVRKIDADGSLGEALRSGSFGDSLREKIKTSIESAVQKSANLKSLPAGMETAASLRNAQFSDGGSGRLWLTIEAELHLSAGEVRELAKQFGQR